MTDAALKQSLSTDRFGAEHARVFSRIALDNVTREFPNFVAHLMLSADDVRRPRELHPIFYGALDWHSSVHMHWLRVAVMRRFPDLPVVTEIERHFDSHFTPETVAGELAYFNAPMRTFFERPYGWAWLLKLSGELSNLAQESPVYRRWQEILQPLTDEIVLRTERYFSLCPAPDRSGVHGNTAFALMLTLDYASAVKNVGLARICEAAARLWYGQPKPCPVANEPTPTDFLSPGMTEMLLMSRILEPTEFRGWLDSFLPRRDDTTIGRWLEPAVAMSRTDGTLAHLDGLNLSRAWCWRQIGKRPDLFGALAKDAPTAAASHMAASLPHIDGHVMGSHWLASFATLALLE